LIFRGNVKDLKVLVTFAVETEFARWRKRAVFRRREVGALAVYHAQIGHADVDVVITGVGWGNARRAMEAVMDPSYSLCISSGFAGGLKPGCAVGDLLAAKSVRTAAKSGALLCNAEFLAEAEESGARRVETLLSAEAVASTATQKAVLADIADAVDMESYAIVAAAQRCNVPAVVFRAVSDSFDQDMPMDFSDAISEDGRVLIGAVLREVAAHPSMLPGLIRLGRQSGRAAERLADFLSSYLEKLSASASAANLLGVAAAL
jgi:adenosylhomocysteine nucleosidase